MDERIVYDVKDPEIVQEGGIGIKNNAKLLALVMAVLVFACACSATAGSKTADERIWADAQRVYRNASLVVRGIALRSHLDENGVSCYDLEINEVLAGSAKPGDLVHVANSAMKEGDTYLLYLAPGGDVYFSEDVSGYTLLTEAPLPVNENHEVLFSGAKLALTDIRASIRAQSRIVSVPTDTYYYQNLTALTNASAEIFIGRVARFPALADTRLRSDSLGATVENTLPASALEVEVFGSIKGALRYGEHVDVLYCPALNDGMIDATTLQPLTYDADDATEPVAGEFYLFFLIGSPDGKQSYYFGVNPIQGFAALDARDRVHTSYMNRALSGYFSLDALVRDIKLALN